ncbi:MAG: hypothetical protein GY816_23200, partial [Cytophagales bacterium]|nr:hypothetical protein [Cytophagales bacterium]
MSNSILFSDFCDTTSSSASSNASYGNNSYEVICDDSSFPGGNSVGIDLFDSLGGVVDSILVDTVSDTDPPTISSLSISQATADTIVS